MDPVPSIYSHEPLILSKSSHVEPHVSSKSSHVEPLVSLKSSHATLLNHNARLQNLPSLTILDHLKFLAILFLASYESYLILVKCDLFYHFVPLVSLFSYFVLNYFFISQPPKIFIVDFSCFKPPSFWRVSLCAFIEHVHLINNFDKQGVEFMSKILNSSGLGPETYLPTSLHYIPPRPNHYDSIEEAKMVLFPIMEDLLAKTNLLPQEIDIVITNCSGFCPNPSLTSLIVNRFKLRPNIKSFHLSGMGCSGSMIAMSLAQNLLSVHKECNAIILSTEILSMGWYQGNEPAKLFINCNFRMGGAAILLSNRKRAQNKSKYQVNLISRAQRAFDDRAYKCAYREEDSDGYTGVTVSRDVLEVFAEMLRDQLSTLGSLILPTLEKLKFLMYVIKKKYVNKSRKPTYVPNFKTVIQHFVLPATGKSVIKKMGKGLNLEEKDMEAALATWHRYGNQSSSSFWYELAYLEAKEKVKQGENILMLGVGSGMKCTSVVLQCVKPIIGESNMGPWANRIHKYPASAI